ncbi:MAG TPA: ABC transporter ATP-binding protein [Xanthobacteraceae bacterium]|nr:ABC transporter ATP-binding protein [Xanthobacteraceae bacterium]
MRSAQREPVLEARNIRVTYRSARGNVTALEDLTATIGKGEFVSVLGPSGCGKSTLLRLISGLMPPSDGEILLDGRTVAGPRPDVGIVFQQPTLLPWQSVLENTLLPVRTLKMNVSQGTAEALQLLRLVGLEKFAQHYPNELSGGMQQRVSIARSLVHKPSLLLMDEPFAALDAMTREHMSKELQRIWMATNQSVIFITHSIPEAVFLSDRILVLSARPGRLVQDLRVDLPRPRTTETLGTPEFAAYTNSLRQLFEKLVKFE